MPGIINPDQFKSPIEHVVDKLKDAAKKDSKDLDREKIKKEIERKIVKY